MDAIISGVAARVVFLSGSEVTYVDAEHSPTCPYRATGSAPAAPRCP